ncbi:hypothetical protein [Anabaena azotica]|uniref:Uncharacterized protein n=1 Tax=Anabaena azotica FACHB-119 TaxID=947527 RepID=A0ABR8D990_9NOST|nr:hypothetical protein [Anabaena azotica]MBD2503762.1 hypothetical protein [Anabaena azotica FACHB-119]
MSLNEIELKQHCEHILKSRRIKNKIVVLCEGAIPKIEGTLSPQTYHRMEQMPDANFYNACIPKWWKEYRPQFINCGSRQDVLNTFFQLTELHNESPEQSYLEPNKLFALVDLDIQKADINNYRFDNTESIFYHLYEQGKINESNSKVHRIWVTGLIHKEAYFLNPDTQSVYQDYATTPNYNGNAIEIEKIYLDMVDELCQDADLKSNWQTGFKRIIYCLGVNCDDIINFPSLWKSKYNQSQNDVEKKQLILALLTIIKAKKYWNKIHPPSDFQLPKHRYREMLMLEIGKFYSEQDGNINNHIPFFFNTLHSLIY